MKNRMITNNRDLDLIITILDNAEGVSKEDFKRLTKMITELGGGLNEKTH